MWIIEQNKSLSERFAKKFAHYHDNVGDRYPQVVGSLDRRGAIIADVGGGRTCAFAAYCQEATIIAVDISADELALNKDVKERRVGDVTKRIPLDDNSVDVVASRFLFEHLSDSNGFVKEAFRVLRPGGSFVTLFPNKRAPFALINRVLSVEYSKRIAYALKPAAKKQGIFPAFYQLCSPREVRIACKSAGFSKVSVQVDYFQSGYYYFCFPLAATSLFYEWIMSKLRVEYLASLVLVTGVK